MSFWKICFFFLNSGIIVAKLLFYLQTADGQTLIYQPVSVDNQQVKMGNYCESQELQFFFSINIILITLGVEAVSEVFLLLVIKFFIKNFSFTTNFIMIQILFQQWSLFFLHRFTAWPLDVPLLLLRPGKVWTIMKWLIPLLKHFSSKLVLN